MTFSKALKTSLVALPVLWAIGSAAYAGLQINDVLNVQRLDQQAAFIERCQDRNGQEAYNDDARLICTKGVRKPALFEFEPDLSGQTIPSAVFQQFLTNASFGVVNDL